MERYPLSVLVLENHPMMRESLHAVIAAEPDLRVVEPASPGNSGLEILLKGQPDVLFLDQKPDIILLSLGNPGLEDLQALGDLHKVWRDTPVLALTSSEVPGQEREALQFGAQAVLTKAASRDEILYALRSMKNDVQTILQTEE